jgi:hypothetical protein
MLYWLKSNADGNDGVEISRGAQRKQYLEAWLVHDMRMKAAKKNQSVTKRVSHERAEFVDHYWCAQEKMDQEWGPQKAESFREIGKLATRPCPVTLNDEDPFKEYKIERKWTRFADGDNTATIVSAEVDADETDIKRLAEMSGADTQDSIQIQPKSAVDVMKNQIAEIKAPPKSHLRKIQDFLTEVKEMPPKAQNEKFAVAFVEELQKQQKDLTTAVSILDKMVSGCSTNDAKMGKLFKRLSNISKSQTEINKIASRNGFGGKVVKRRKKD